MKELYQVDGFLLPLQLKVLVSVLCSNSLQQLPQRHAADGRMQREAPKTALDGADVPTLRCHARGVWYVSPCNQIALWTRYPSAIHKQTWAE